MATAPTLRRDGVPRTRSRRRPSAPAVGVAAALILMALAAIVPAVSGWHVQVGFPPLFATWMPRVGPGTLVAVPVGVLGVCFAGRLSHSLSWRKLMVTSWLTSLVWLASLLLVDVRRGRQSYPDVNDFLQTARATSNVGQTLHDFISRIPVSPNPWPTHVAGHPVGALLFFVALVRIGLGSNLAAGIVITAIASTIPLAAMSTLRVLGAERAARWATPFLVLAPAAIWEAVSADAVFTSVSAWGIAALAVGAVRRSPRYALSAGLLLGCSAEMSYGILPLGAVALAVVVVIRSYGALAWAGAGALLVVGGFWLAGFALWDAYPLVQQRYWAGIASARPTSYWIWGNLAALCFSAGPALGPVTAEWVHHLRRGSPGSTRELNARVVCWLGGAAILAVITADVSLLSKAEVERIWLPFVPWLLVLTALLPARWRRPALAIQVAAALLVQHLLVTAW